MIESVIGAKILKDVGQTVAIAGGIGVAGYLGYKSLKAVHDWGEDVVDEIKSTPAGIFYEASKQTPTGKVIEGFRKFIQWGFTPVENTQ